VIFFFDVLMNDVVGETRQRKASARNENLNFVSGRELLNAIEDVGGAVPG
jgi:hypothetical protein